MAKRVQVGRLLTPSTGPVVRSEMVANRGMVLPQVVRPANGRQFTLEELQAAVGGYIQAVELKPGNGRGTMYINEEGKLRGLPRNEAATLLARLYEGDYIVGNALLVEKEDK